jgi:protein gp37
MGETTAIAWCHHTFNPVWGCVKVDKECSSCYAEAFDKRVGGAHWGPKAERRTFGDKHWAEPLAWDRAAAAAGERRRAFCASMSDIFEDHPVVDGERPRLWRLVRETPNLDWMLLTKRPERIAANLPAGWGTGWPNAWLGTSVGYPGSLTRAHELIRVPAAIHFLSMEPLIEAVTLPAEILAGLDLVIVGGESAMRPRLMDVEWARALHGQCKAAGVAFFMKQLGGRPFSKGEEMKDFPKDLRVREMPRPRRPSRLQPSLF